MSKIRYKVTYDCDAGCHYGECDKKNTFLLLHNCSTDYTEIVHIYHSDGNPITEKLGTFTDEGISALIKILTEKENKTETWNQDDYDFMNT